MVEGEAALTFTTPSGEIIVQKFSVSFENFNSIYKKLI